MASANQLKVEIIGDPSSLLGALDRATSGIKTSTAQIEGMAAGVGKGIENLLAPIMALAGVMGGGALFKGAVDQAVDFGKETGKIQRVMGGTREEAAALSIAIGDIYGDTETFLGGIQKLTKTINSNEGALKGMGVATRDASGHLLPMGQIVQNVNQALLQYREGIDRDAAAQAVLGKSWAEWLVYLKLTPQAIEEARKKTEELGLTMGPEAQERVAKYRAAMNDAVDAMQAFKVRIGLEVMPTLTEFGKWFSEVAPGAITHGVNVLRGVGSVLSYTTVQVALAAAAFKVALLPSLMKVGTAIVAWVQTVQVQMHLASLAWRTGPAVSQFEALKSAVMGLINPWMLATAALVGGGILFEYWLNSAERGAARLHELNQATLQTTDRFLALTGEATALDATLRSTTSSVEQKRKAQDVLAVTLTQLNQLYPEFNAFLVDEAGNQRSIAEAIALATEKEKDNLEVKIMAMEIGIGRAKRLQEERANAAAQARKNSEDSNFADSGGGFIAGWIDDNRAASAAKSVKSLTQDLDKLRDTLKALQGLPDAMNGKGNKRYTPDTGKPPENTWAEEMRKLEVQRLKAEKDLTLEAQRANDVLLAEKALEQDLADLRKKAKDQKWTGAQTAQAEAAAAEKFQEEIDINIPAKYRALREKAEAEAAKKRQEWAALEEDEQKNRAESQARFEEAALQQRLDREEISQQEFYAAQMAAENRRYLLERASLTKRLAQVEEFSL